MLDHSSTISSSSSPFELSANHSRTVRTGTSQLLGYTIGGGPAFLPCGN